VAPTIRSILRIQTSARGRHANFGEACDAVYRKPAPRRRSDQAGGPILPPRSHDRRAATRRSPRETSEIKSMIPKYTPFNRHCATGEEFAYIAECSLAITSQAMGSLRGDPSLCTYWAMALQCAGLTGAGPIACLAVLVAIELGFSFP
jgi:hypothetical protein